LSPDWRAGRLHTSTLSSKYYLPRRFARLSDLKNALPPSTPLLTGKWNSTCIKYTKFTSSSQSRRTFVKVQGTMAPRYEPLEKYFAHQIFISVATIRRSHSMWYVKSYLVHPLLSTLLPASTTSCAWIASHAAHKISCPLVELVLPQAHQIG